MCIIAVKPIGVKLPDDMTLKNMWDNNPDGAGFMYPDDNGHVMIRKGFMKWKSFNKNITALAERMDLTSIPLIMHFRITTHGGTNAANTHPFPVTDHVETLKKTSVCTSLGIAHNGIIHSVTPRAGLSDTMEYIASQLAPLKRALPNFLENKDAMLLVKNAIGSTNKFAFLTGEKQVFTVGDFVKHDGMLYSNNSFENYYTRWRNVNWAKYSPTKTEQSDYDKLYSKWYEDAEDYYDYYGQPASPYGSQALLPAETWDEHEQTKLLMELKDGDYIRTSDGEMFEGGYVYMIDKDEHVYEYDYDSDMAVLLSGASAFSSEGLPLRFHYAEAVEYPVANTKEQKAAGKATKTVKSKNSKA